MTRTETQNEQILQWLMKRRSITPLEALHMFGCLRLAARIFDLRADGHNIETQRIEVGDDGKQVAQYRLIHTSAAGLS